MATQLLPLSNKTSYMYTGPGHEFLILMRGIIAHFDDELSFSIHVNYDTKKINIKDCFFL